MFFPREIDSSIMGRMADMNRAAEAGAYISALSLALTIPDACGLRLYPDLDKKSSERYAKWFDEYVARWDYVESPEEAAFWDAAGEPKPRAAYFNGSDCYQLRCVYLHEAVNAPHMERGKTPFATIQFRLFDDPGRCDHVEQTTSGAMFTVPPESGENVTFGEGRQSSTYRLDLDIRKFFESMTRGVTRFLEDHPDMNEVECLRKNIFYRPILDFRKVE